MRDVQQPVCPAGLDGLQAASQPEPRQCLGDASRIQRPLQTRRLEQRQHRGRVAVLEFAAQARGGQLLDAPMTARPAPAAILTRHIMKIAPSAQQPGAAVAGMSGNRPGHLVGGEHRGYAFTHDAGLFERDRLDVGPQPVAVIEAHVGDQRSRRLDRVGRVEPPAHTDLQYPGVEAGLGKHDHGRERAELEISQGQLIACGLDARQRRRDRRIVSRLAVDSDALVVIDDVR